MNTTMLNYYSSIYDKLIGKVITNVYYEELDYQDDEEHWKLFEDIHSVDMNVILELRDEIIQLQWDNEFECYGVGVKLLNAFKINENTRAFRISNKYWNRILGVPIKDVIVYWHISNVTSNHFENDLLVSSIDKEVKLPQTLELQFDNGKSVFISAMELKSDKEISYWADHLTILFDSNQVQRYYLDKDHMVSVKNALLS